MHAHGQVDTAFVERARQQHASRQADKPERSHAGTATPYDDGGPSTHALAAQHWEASAADRKQAALARLARP